MVSKYNKNITTSLIGNNKIAYYIKYKKNENNDIWTNKIYDQSTSIWGA